MDNLKPVFLPWCFAPVFSSSLVTGKEYNFNPTGLLSSKVFSFLFLCHECQVKSKIIMYKSRALLYLLSSLNSFGLNGSRIRRCETRGWSGDPHCERKSIFFFLHCCFIKPKVLNSLRVVCLQNSIKKTCELTNLLPKVQTIRALFRCYNFS